MARPTKSSIGRIDGLEISTWVLFTVFYALFVGIIGGVIKTELPEIIYIWNIPLDIQQAGWVFGLALWGVISLFLHAHYRSK